MKILTITMIVDSKKDANAILESIQNGIADQYPIYGMTTAIKNPNNPIKTRKK